MAGLVWCGFAPACSWGRSHRSALLRRAHKPAWLALSSPLPVRRLQGGAAYGFDALFTPTARPPGGCLPAASNATGQMVCAFWSAQPFHLSFCSNTSWIPW